MQARKTSNFGILTRHIAFTLRFTDKFLSSTTLIFESAIISAATRHFP